MYRLPPIVSGRFAWHLPLADRTAARITSALLAGSTEQARERFDRILATDPSLLLWTIGQAHAVDGQTMATLRQGAAWLENRQFGCGDWLESNREARIADRGGLRPRFAHLAAKSFLTAEIARKDVAAAPHIDASTVDQVVLAGLLSHADEWLGLAVSGPSEQDHPSEQDQVHYGLPEWLGHVCQTDGGPPGARPAWADSVLRAKGLADKAIETMLPGDHLVATTTLPLDRVPSNLREVYEYWLATDEQAVQQLTVLMGKLQELRQWQADFDGKLETEKLSAMKELAYGARHEINNPLAHIALRAQTLVKEEHDPQRRRKLLAIHRQAMRAHEMISDLMLFARPPELDLQPVDLIELIDRLVVELADQARERGTKISHDRSPTSVVVLGDPVQLTVALRALCENSLEATGHGGQIRLAAVAVTTGQATDVARLTVSDNGPGISELVRPHLFDPFFSGREAGRGLGFGLSKCWRIVTDHGGRIDVRSESEQGATFVIELPKAK
ncbi:MAG: sensor histidine kinase [Pirellulales bacterium]